MLRHLLTTVLLSVPLAAAASAQAGTCPFSGIATTTFGTGTGTCSLSVLTVALDTSACRLDFGYAQDPVSCGNVVLTQNALLLGVTDLPNGIPLGPLFLPGSELHVVPLAILGPFPGKTASLVLPDDPALIGARIFFQSLPAFFSSFPFPGQGTFGSSTALGVTLL